MDFKKGFLRAKLVKCKHLLIFINLQEKLLKWYLKIPTKNICLSSIKISGERRHSTKCDP